MEPTHSSPPPPTSVSSPNSLHQHDERVRMSSPSSSNNVEVGQDLTSRNEVRNSLLLLQGVLEFHDFTSHDHQIFLYISYEGSFTNFCTPPSLLVDHLFTEAYLVK